MNGRASPILRIRHTPLDYTAALAQREVDWAPGACKAETALPLQAIPRTRKSFLKSSKRSTVMDGPTLNSLNSGGRATVTPKRWLLVSLVFVLSLSTMLARQITVDVKLVTLVATV